MFEVWKPFDLSTPSGTRGEIRMTANVVLPAFKESIFGRFNTVGIRRCSTVDTDSSVRGEKESLDDKPISAEIQQISLFTV